MKLLDTSTAADLIHNIIHKDTQQHETHIDLTAQSIHRISDAGQLDFGGSEFRPASTETVTPGKKHPEDDYGWWHLPQGNFQVIFNESIGFNGKQLGIIMPHQHALKAGITAGTQLITPDMTQEDDLVFPLQVPQAGCHIKENARIASLLLFQA
jgi:hypothetical protein